MWLDQYTMIPRIQDQDLLEYVSAQLFLLHNKNCDQKYPKMFLLNNFSQQYLET